MWSLVGFCIGVPRYPGRDNGKVKASRVILTTSLTIHPIDLVRRLFALLYVSHVQMQVSPFFSHLFSMKTVIGCMMCVYCESAMFAILDRHIHLNNDIPGLCTPSWISTLLFKVGSLAVLDWLATQICWFGSLGWDHELLSTILVQHARLHV